MRCNPSACSRIVPNNRSTLNRAKMDKREMSIILAWMHRTEEYWWFLRQNLTNIIFRIAPELARCSIEIFESIHLSRWHIQVILKKTFKQFLQLNRYNFLCIFTITMLHCCDSKFNSTLFSITGVLRQLEQQSSTDTVSTLSRSIVRIYYTNISHSNFDMCKY